MIITSYRKLHTVQIIQNATQIIEDSTHRIQHTQWYRHDQAQYTQTCKNITCLHYLALSPELEKVNSDNSEEIIIFSKFPSNFSDFPTNFDL